MIKIILGNVGSGKTALMVREMYLNKNRRKTYSNIVTRLKSQINIAPEMIIDREIVDYKRNRKSGEQEPVYKHKLNIDFWKKVTEKEGAINICLDEAHSIINSRRSMSVVNIIVTDWIALIRRVLGQAESGYGELIFITQLIDRVDTIIRQMATNILYTICHYFKSCKDCGLTWRENSEMPESMHQCSSCGSYSIKKHTHALEVWHFSNITNYRNWKDYNQKTYYKHYIVNDIETYFKYYSTLQWDNLFSAYY